MDDLVAFFTARLDELEEAAGTWCTPREDHTHWQYVGRRDLRYDNGRSEAVRAIDVRGTPVDWAEQIWVKWDTGGVRTRHLVLNDPASALADVAADRAILARYEALRHPVSLKDRAIFPALAEVVAACIRDRAARFSAHQDYRSEWAP